MERDVVVKAFGKALKKKRKDLDLSQQKLEEDTDLALKTIGRIEQGKRGADLLTLFKLRTKTGISIDELLDEAFKNIDNSHPDQ